jgi:dynein heavy chain
MFFLSKFSFLVLAAWLKGRSNREKQVFSELFDQSFLAVYTWGTQNCEFTMEVLQCNVIQQMISILEGLVPYSKEIEQAASMSIAGSNEGETNGLQVFPFFIHLNSLSHL